MHNLGDGAFPEHHLPVPDGRQHSQEPHLIDCEGYDTHVGLLPQHPSNPPEPLVPITYIAQRPSPSVSLQSPSAFLADAAPLQSTRIADILPRNTALSILKLFFDHVSTFARTAPDIAKVYCIIPVVHYPTFMDAVDAREDERNPMFFGGFPWFDWLMTALVMAMLSCTLGHVPNSLLPVGNARTLSNDCLRACYAVVRRSMDSPSVDLVTIK